MAENEGTVDSGLTIHKKLEPKTICPDLMANPGKGSTRWLYRIGGKVSDIVEGTGTFGKWVALVGDFAAVRFDTGEQFTAGKCFLPSGIGQLIATQLEALQEKDENASIDITFDIGITYNKREPDNPGKYDYVVRKPDGGEVQRKQVAALLKIAPLPPGVQMKALPSGEPNLPFTG